MQREIAAARFFSGVASKLPEAVAILLATCSAVPGAPPPDPRAVKPKMALRAQLPVPAVRGWWSRCEAAAMRVSALRHRVAGEALPGFLVAVSFTNRTPGTGTRSKIENLDISRASTVRHIASRSHRLKTRRVRGSPQFRLPVPK